MRRLAWLLLLSTACDENKGPPPATQVQIDPSHKPVAITAQEVKRLWSKRNTSPIDPSKPFERRVDPWSDFAGRQKNSDEVAVLVKMVDEPDAMAAQALEALVPVHSSALVPFWRRHLAASPKGDPQRGLLLQGLLAAGGKDVVPEVYAHLGESQELDQRLVAAAEWDHGPVGEAATKAVNLYLAAHPDAGSQGGGSP